MQKPPVSDKNSNLTGRIIAEIFIVTAALLSIFTYLMKELSYSYSYINKISYIPEIVAPINEDIPKENIVNVNTAGINELMTLEGIGEVTAQNIISYREKNNGFLTVDELLKVDGIGESKLEKIRNYVTLE